MIERQKKLVKEFSALKLKEVNVDKIKTYLEAGVPIDSPDEFDETTLIKAIRARNIEVAKYLISQSANIYATNVCGETTMMMCAKRGYLELAQALFERGYDINQITPLTHQSVLGLAISSLNIKIFLCSFPA